MAYTEKQLTTAINDLWVLLKPYLTEAERDELTDKDPIIREIDEFGVGGPLGSGLGRFGGHAVD